jgi:hypothetical protein
VNESEVCIKLVVLLRNYVTMMQVNKTLQKVLCLKANSFLSEIHCILLIENTAYSIQTPLSLFRFQESAD